MDDGNSTGGTSFHGVAAVTDLPGSATWKPCQQKRTWLQAISHKVNQLDGDKSAEDVENVEEPKIDYKNKQIMEYDIDWQKKVKGSSSSELIASSMIFVENDTFDSSELELHDDDIFIDDDEYGDYEFDDEDNDDSYLNQILADKFDDLDLPPGVEATVPWLQKPEVTNDYKSQKDIEEEINAKFVSFKKFDVVKDFSDHHFTSRTEKMSKDGTKRIQLDWKLLENDLPESIYVRVYEDRMDLLRAAIVGPAGTPYHDGLFFFDVYFPAAYPNSPPEVKYHAHGLRLNPNLYACGKVCLSLLNTWQGHGCEKWNKATSTMLQVLLSIQALVLNEKPYFNEPGYASMANTAAGEKHSSCYNENAFIFSCKTMLYSLRAPPKHFEDLVSGHFRKYGRKILMACKAYMEGVPVGSYIPEEEPEDKPTSKDHLPVDKPTSWPCQRSEEKPTRTGSLSHPCFKTLLEKLFETLLMEFTVKGADTVKFLVRKDKKHGPSSSGDA